ncbi:uncharacterized protein LOC141614523 [Silene latifolia]|uniref:uncharacterized protein LOC141614523 n=1 Tax=Silene latifolia TaxID=37657 RepID=UPI003D77844C
MNNPNKQLDIRRFLHQNKIGLFGLVETKIKEHDFLSTLHNLGHYWEGVNNNYYHPGGRVWIIWVPQLFSVNVIASSIKGILSCGGCDIGTSALFWFTVVYGFNSEGDRHDLWNQLKVLKDNCTVPWSICGDFNSLLNFNERIGSEVSWNEICEFRHCVDYCEVTDIQAHGSFFTWNNKQDPTTRVFSRLDRFLVNLEWMELYPNSYAYFMNEGTFDHCPCIFYRTIDQPTRKPGFRYFNMWSLDLSFKTIVQHEWNKTGNGVKMYQVLLDDLQEQLKQNPQDQLISRAEREAAESFTLLHKAKYSYLQQKSKSEWLKRGDENTRFFHCQIKQRQIHNKIFSIKDIHVFGKVIDDHCPDFFFVFVSPEEIKQCFFSIPADKSPGPDGFSSQFFKDSWDIVGPSICEAITDFFSSGKILKQLNTTNITLIPKISNPQSVLEFRPIACCNTIYKCIAKLLCNRLGDVLPDLVSINQGGFIKGRNIVENVLICQDLVRLYNRKAASPQCLLKIDLRKAYDSVE